MRSLWRTFGAVATAVPREIVAIGISMWVTGTSYGAAAHGIGLAWWQIVLMACVVLAGSSEFVMVAVVAGGGLPVVGALTGLLMNIRNVSYGLSAGRFFRRDRTLFAAAHLVNDETAVYSAPHRDPATARSAFLICGVAVALCWPLGALTGALVGQLIGSPEALGLDAAFPALLVALALPAVRDRDTRWAAIFGATIALATAGFVAAGIPVVLALLGIPLGLLVTSRRAVPAREKATS
ncbi:AzlC family ABC transporter permease [Gordonia liuliyuniae]|uniref:AzlC family ABC transporter permease n=1 Tax=Gordonia liuliyuniae TaxID=2911517 RepID=A0ABS9IPC4_9ACTN|nr:AzlC family ABC transporter permease [Gordonia liuliyuniae]MCF8587382.1 AzlC family ABC transporter permease [Gordonia liuliyuniae]